MKTDDLIVAVDGATGYLGNHLVARLRRNGIAVRCIVHPAAQEQDIAFLESTGAKLFVASLAPSGTADDPLAKALGGVDVAVHLIGSVAPRKGESLSDLHGSQTAHLVKTAKSCGVKKLVQVTALGTDSNAVSAYHLTKWQAEQNVVSSGLKFVILRPSLIIGREVGNRDSKLIARYMKLIRTRRSVPVIGAGNNRLQPVFVGDLVEALEKAIVESRFDNNTYEIGGDEILSMRQIVEKLMVLANLKKRIKGVSPLLAGVMAAFCEKLQSVPLVSRDQIKLSLADNVCTNNALRTIFGIFPKSMDQALSTYVQQTPAGGQLESTGNRR